MNYQFHQITNSGNQIANVKAQKITPGAEVAVIAHIFYVDIWKEIHSYLKRWSIPYDLYITVPPHIEDTQLAEIFEDNPDVHIYRCENRGRDVLPFLQTLSHIGVDSYRYICKLHTKKTGNSPLGDVWRRQLYFDLLGSQEWVEKIIKSFDEDDTIGQITGKNTVLDSKRYAYGNNGRIKWLCEQCSVPFSEEYTFAGGTMFWSRTDVMKPLIELFESGKLEFEEERGQKDHTIAHAIERFFGILVKSEGKVIAPSPSDYAQMPKELVEDTSALVLSQQYAGQDVYEKINELNEYVHELEAIAESMRLKNRIKRLPKDAIRVTKEKGALSVAALLALKEQKSKVDFKKVITPTVTVLSNPQVFKKVFYYLKRGEVKYLYTKAKEKIKKNLANSNDFIKIDPKEYFTPFDTTKYSLEGKRVDIIIPVYNGYEYLEPLFNSIKKNTTAKYRLIITEDASPDERVKPLLGELVKEHQGAVVLENEENLGFVKSVNRALKEVSENFVILNTDTEVPPLWLERLMYPIFKMPNVASTTPFTNAGTVASFPKFLEDNAIFEGLQVDVIDKHFQRVNAQKHYASMPTGIGFCMGINYKLTQEIGFFDEEVFGKGYGEENDWCQRAIENGYQNILVPNLFVYHKHGGSFPSELKQKLLDENYQKLLQKHPTYDKQVHEYIAKDPHKELRKLLIITASSSSSPLWVMFDHAIGGGANHYADELLETQKAANRNTLKVAYDYYTNEYKCYYHYKEYQYELIMNSIADIEEFLNLCEIEELFLNSLVSYPQQKELLETFDRLTRREYLSLTIPIHDFFALCPSYNLLNQDGNYCGVPDSQTCAVCMQQSKQEWRNFFSDDIDILSWRELWSKLLTRAQTILCFSDSSKEIVQKAYPQIEESKFSVVPHSVSGIEKLTMPEKKSGEPFVIGVLGGINYAKGASIVKELVGLIERKSLNMKVVVIGEITEQIRGKHFHVTGRYKKSKLPALIRQYKVDTFVIPSIWPETFSYTSEEVMQMGLPIVVFDIGAPAERVKEYEKGYIVKDVSGKALLETIERELVEKR